MGMNLDEGEFQAMLRKYFLLLFLLLTAAGAAVASVLPNDEYYPQQDYLWQISANYAWALSTGTYTVKIAVVDSGVQSDHPDLSVLPGWDFVDNDDTANPDPFSSSIYYHGTAVAGIAAAKGNNGIGTTGVAWNAEIIPVKVLRDDTTTASTRIADGIRWAVDNGADIINLSLGMPSWEDISSNPVIKANLIEQIRTGIPQLKFVPDIIIETLAKTYFESSVSENELYDAVQYASTNNVLLVAAMGNTEVGANLGGSYGTVHLILPQSITSIPAGFPEVIGVAGVSENNAIGGGSLVGSGDKTTELAAPYFYMMTTSPNSEYTMVGQGTSYATPVVSGVAALVKGTYPYLSANEIREILQKTAVQYGDQVDAQTGKDPRYGYGVVNAYAAVRDTTSPVIFDVVTSNSVSVNIQFSVTDNAAADYKNIGVDWDSLSITINGENMQGNFSITDDTITVDLPEKQHYGATLDVEIAAADRHGNTVSVNFSYTTENPPTPNIPNLNWFNADERNTSTNQIIEVSRPEISDELIGYWGLVLNGEIIRTDIPSADAVCTLNNITDNQTISASIFWIDELTGAASPFSPEASLTLGNRTPPQILGHTPANNATRVPVDSVILVNVTNNNIGMNAFAEISTDNINALDGQNIFNATDIFQFTPNKPFDYNEHVFVTFNVTDNDGNTASVTFSFKTELPPPAAPQLTWDNETERNTTDNQQITVLLNQTVPNETKFWRIYINGEPAATVNISADSHTFYDIPDNLTITAQISWISIEDEESGLSPESAPLSIGNRTPPEILDHLPANGATRVPPDSAILINVTNNNMGTMDASIEVSTDNINVLTGTSTFNDDLYEFTPDNAFGYNEHVFVTFNVTDNAGNTASVAFSFKTELPPPAAPRLTWDNETERNSMDHQQITIWLDQPAPNETKEWRIYVDDELVATVDINVNSYTIYDMPDDLTIAAKISWVSVEDEESGLSPESAPLYISDRTPPTFVSSIPEASSSNVSYTTSYVAITVTDNHSGINAASYDVEISTDNINSIPHTLMTPFPNNIYLLLNNQFNYNDLVFVTLNFADNAGNTANAAFSFRVQLPQPAAPLLIWDNETERNTTDNQQITISLDQIVRPDIGITHWKIYKPGDMEAIATVDINIDHYVFTELPDNTSVSLQIAWVSDTIESEKSASMELYIGDRTPPEMRDVYPAQVLEIQAGVTPSFGLGFSDETGLTDNHSVLTIEAETQRLVNNAGQTAYGTPESLTGVVTINAGGGLEYILFILDNTSAIGTKISATINAFDTAGNSVVLTRSWLTTAELSMPEAPALTWVNSKNYNTTDNQIVLVHRPPTQNNAISEWNIKYRLGSNSDYSEITSISILTEHVEITVSDNQNVTAYVYWLLPGSDIMAWSPENSIQLADRTPPIIYSEPGNSSANIPITAPICLYFTDHSEIPDYKISLAVTINEQAVEGSYLESLSLYKSESDFSKTYQGRLVLGQNLQYDNTVNIQVAALDAAGNSATYNFSFSTLSDITPPTIYNIVTGNNINSKITFYAADTESQVNFDTLRVSVNEHSLNIVHQDNTAYVQVIPSPNPLYYGEAIFVTISVADYSGNTAVCTFSYTTEIPPTPGLIYNINWTNKDSRNTADDQRLKINRPATINNYLEEWELSVSGNGEIIYTRLYPAASENVEISVSDNQTIAVRLRWRDADTDVYSPYSPWSSALELADRTAPTLNMSTLTPQPGSVNVSITADISFELFDQDSPLSYISLYINDQYKYIAVRTDSNDYVYTNPAPFFNYKENLRITINAEDYAGNQLSVTYSFTTQADDTKPEIQIISPNNGDSDLDSPLTLNFTAQDFDSGLSLNLLEILLNGTPVNYTGSLSYIADGIQIKLLLDVSFNAEHYLTINVADKSGNTQNATLNFTTKKTAFHILESDSYYGSIQQAVSRAAPDQTLEIDPGEYTETGINITKNITISGNVTLNAQKQGNHFVISGAQVTLNRIHLLNGQSGNGGSIGLHNNSTLKIYDSVISGNRALSFGGAIYKENSNLELHNVQAYGNQANIGAFEAGDGYGTVLIKNSRFARHQVEDYGLFYNSGNLRASRSDFFYNQSVRSTGLFYRGKIELENCTVYGNTALGSGEPSVYSAAANDSAYLASFTAINSILWDNSAPMFAPNNQNTTIIHSNLPPDNSAANINCLSAAPSFADAANGDFHLTSADPGIDRGTNNVTLTDGKYYEYFDLGSYEYDGLFINGIQPAAGSQGNQANPILSFVIYNQSTGLTDITDIILTINITGNTKVYQREDLVIATINDTLQAELDLGYIGTSQTVNFSIAVKNSSGGEYSVPESEFYTRRASFKYLVFDPPTASVQIGYDLMLNVLALDDNRNTVAGQEISFNFKSANSGGASFEPVTALSGGNGYAQTKLKSGNNENVVLEIQAWSEGISSNVLTVTINPLLRIVKNIDLGQQYISLRAAFEDPSLADGHTLEISSNYALAEAGQKEAELNWPNKNNLTLKGNNVTTNFKIQIKSSSDLTATLDSLIFHGLSNPLRIENESGTVNIVNSIFSDNSGQAINASVKYLKIENSTFSNNQGNEGGALYYYNGLKVNIQRSHFHNNTSQYNGGALYLNSSSLQTVYIGQSSFSENSVLNGNGSALSLEAANANLLVENSLLVNNKSSALRLSNFSGATLNFNTIVGNATAFSFSSNKTLSLLNSIIWDNSTQLASGSGALYGVNTLAQTLLDGPDNLSADPQLDAAYRLISTDSPAFNKASANYALNTDYAGDSRPILGGYDLGALEFDPGGSVAYIDGKDYYANLQDALDAADNNDTIIVIASKITLSAPLSWPSKNITLKGLFQTNKIQGNRQTAMIVSTGNGDIQLADLTIVSFNNVINQQNTILNSITLNNLLILDNHAVNDAGENGALYGAVVNTSKAARITVLNTLVSGNSANKDGGLFYTQATNDLSPLQISNTVLDSTSATFGGVAVRVNAVLEYVTINNATATFAGGAFVESKVSAYWSIFSNGHSGLEGGVFLDCVEILAEHCLFKNNTAGLHGGVFSVYPSTNPARTPINIKHSVFHNNTGPNSTNPGNIAYRVQGSIDNSVFWANGDINKEDFSGSSVVINYSAGDKFTNNSGTNLKIDAPRFINPDANDYRVSYNSPLIDSGSPNAAVYIYDGLDIGIYEYDGTYLNEYQPTAGAQDISVNSPVTFRIRDHRQNIDPSTVVLLVNGVEYIQPTAQITISLNASAADLTDFYLTFTPSPSFRFSASINIVVNAASVKHAYQFRTLNPKEMYVSALNGDDANDGSAELPFQTIAKAMSIAGHDSEIFLLGETYAENILWNNNTNISLIGTTNTIVSGNIDIAQPVTVNLKNFVYRGEINNPGRLYIEALRSYNLERLIFNQPAAYARLQNSVLAGITQAVYNDYGARTEIIHSNLVNNLKIFDGSNGAAVVANSILDNSPFGAGTITAHHNLADSAPLFTDDTFTEIAFNSPAVDAADDSDSAWTVSRDMRGLARPEHHQPDIGAWESDKPNIILLQPAAADYNNVLVTNDFKISIIETPDKISTAQISLNLPVDNSLFTLQSTGYVLTTAPSLNYFDTAMTYNLIITAENASGNIAQLVVTLSTLAAPQDIYVDKDYTGHELGFADYPFRNIQNALNHALHKELSSITINLVNDYYDLAAEINLPENNSATVGIVIVSEQGATLDAQEKSRIFNFGKGYNITLQNLTLVKGRSVSGGAILNNAALVLNNLTLRDNNTSYSANEGGGAIFNNSLLTVDQTIFQNNSADGYSTNSGGGAIFNNGSTTLNKTIFIGNRLAKSGNGAGGAIYNKGVLYGADLTISGNSANNGGSICVSNGDLYLERSLFRGNTATQNGGAIYIINSKSNLINNIFDYNKAANNAGAIYYSSAQANNIYQSSFIRNTAANYYGAIYNINSIKPNIYNSLFIENTAAGKTAHVNTNANKPNLYNCYPADINTAGVSANLSAIDKYDYVPKATAKEIVDNENSRNTYWISDTDYKNKSRSEPYDIGALEYRPSILLPIDAGYYAENENGDMNEFTADSTVTIYREIDGQWLGALTLPSSNQIDYERADFRSLSLNANYLDTSAVASLNGKTYWLEMYSPDKYPFISADGKVLSDYYGNMTDNIYLTGNAVISPNLKGGYTLSAQALHIGKFELVHPAVLNLAPALIVKNFSQTSTINISVQDKYGTPLQEVPVTLSTDGAGSFGDNSANPASATSSIIFNHPPQEELSAVITGNYAELTVTISVRTINDKTAPTINLIEPLALTGVAITQNIVFLVTDNESEIATFNFILNDIDRTAELRASANNIYIYAGRLELNQPYTITINAANNVELVTAQVFVFQTKADTDPPAILAYPAPGQTRTPQDTPLSFNIQDLESGLSLNTLTLEVSGNVISAADYTIDASDIYNAQIIYTPPDFFELGSTVSVTINIEDNLGHQRELAYNFVVITDFRPPTVNTFTITQGNPNTDNAVINIFVEDNYSDLDPDSISISINNPLATMQVLSITTANKQLTAELLLTNIGYNKNLQITLNIADVFGNTANSTQHFLTAPDLSMPSIQPVEPVNNNYSVSIDSRIIVDLIDTMSGVNPIYTILQINNETRYFIDLSGSLTPSSDGKSYQLNYQPPELEYDTEYRVTVTARDNNNYNGSSGNISVLAYVFRTIPDTFPPATPDISPLGYTDTSRALIRITGNKEIKSEILVYVNGELEMIDRDSYSQTTFALTLNFSDRSSGNIDIIIVAQDQAKNTATANAVTFNFVDFYQEGNSPNVSVLALAGTFDDDETVTLNDVTYSNYYPNANETLWISSVWELNFSGAANKGIEVTIPLTPDAASYNNLAVYYFDAQEYKWKMFTGNAAQLAANGAVSFTTNKPGMYTLGSALNRNATIVENYNVIIAPNPVKLTDGPLHFVYRAPNNCSAELRIYTISGRLLYKTTKDLPATNDFPAEFIWSGENDFNDQIGNGVYIVLLTLTDQVTGEKHIIKSKFAVLN
ncbi:hypothetical protein NO1_0514 [Candidatus Termititenax aidoneus]|uniref:Uncharacterized protein n=1 Tax=Termititenax aidoneus TaxID=2218524 RepID=A0A388T9Z7_TERA1|nr:hypothetical protein NO1_0514 [Candidatus Termititenax aidoneus]